MDEGSHVFAHDTSDNLIYEGWAVRIAVPTSNAVWKIKKQVLIVGSGGAFVLAKEQWADSNHLYDNIWDNRTTIDYG